MGCDVFRFRLPVQQFLDPIIRLLPTRQVLEFGHSGPLLKLQGCGPGLQLNEHFFWLLHHDFATSDDLEIASVVERKSRSVFGLSKRSYVRSHAPPTPQVMGIFYVLLMYISSHLVLVPARWPSYGWIMCFAILIHLIGLGMPASRSFGGDYILLPQLLHARNGFYWKSFDRLLYSILEINTGLICSCIPSFKSFSKHLVSRPFFQRYIWNSSRFLPSVSSRSPSEVTRKLVAMSHKSDVWKPRIISFKWWKVDQVWIRSAVIGSSWNRNVMKMTRTMSWNKQLDHSARESKIKYPG